MSNEDDARSLAATFRQTCGLADDPIKDVFALVHTWGEADVLSIDADDAEHGLSMLDRETQTVVIAVATTAHPMRQRSSIAHELGHVLAGDLGRDTPLVPGERGPEEIRADAFARHLLLPLSGLERRFSSTDRPTTLSELSDVVQQFGVSPAIAAIQLRNASLIDVATCTQWRTKSTRSLAASFGWLSQYRAMAEESRLPRAPQALMRRAVEGYRRGVLSLAEVATWYGADPAELELQLPPRADLAGDDEWFSDEPLFPGDDAGLSR